MERRERKADKTLVKLIREKKKGKHESDRIQKRKTTKQ